MSLLPPPGCPSSPVGPPRAISEPLVRLVRRGLLKGAPPVTLPLLWHPLHHCLLYCAPHEAPPLQDFVLMKERTLDEAPRPPKKAMDYSSSSEDVESSEDEEEESNGEPSEGSRDTPGARYGASCGGEGTPIPRQQGRRAGGLWGKSKGSSSPFPEWGSLAITASQFFLPISREWGTGWSCHLSPTVPSLGVWPLQCPSVASRPLAPGRNTYHGARLLCEGQV